MFGNLLRYWFSQASAKIKGIVFFISGLFFALAILSYSPKDPSLNHATNAVVKNWMGTWGAYIADPLMQAFGYGITVLIVGIISYGISVLHNGRNRPFLLRSAMMIFSMLPCSLFFACLDKQGQIMSHGGYLGLWLSQELNTIIARKFILLFSGVVSGFAYLIAVGLSFDQWKTFLMFVIGQLKIIALLIGWIFKSLYVLTRRSIPRQDSESNESAAFIIPEMPSPVIEVASRVRSDYKKKPVQSTLQLVLDEYPLPPTSLLKDVPLGSKKAFVNEHALNQNSKLLQQVLQDFGVNGNIVKINPGPVVTLYELEPSAGTKSSRVIGLADDISRSMSAVSARIAVIPGKNALGIELPNSIRETVYLRELMETDQYKQYDGQLPLILGKNIAGDPVIADLAKMPHLLVAGTTGSGKSVAINTMILSLLYKHSPKECQLIMIDPKMLELSVYEGIPHLLAPVVTEAKKAVSALKWVVKEMEDRYRAMSSLGVRNIHGYNKAIEEAKRKGENLFKTVQTGFDSQTGRPIFENIALPSEILPNIVVIVDEMADLMIVAGKEIESSIQRLAQMARAAGIHIIMATQRPSVDVITGVIKANFPTRISFQVTSKIDSRTILGEQGAEQLLGMGDMLYMMGGGRVDRIHGPFVGDKEVEEVVKFLKENGGAPVYKTDITASDESDEMGVWESTGDDLYDQAVAIVLRDKRPTTSYIQRCLKIGYNKAATLIEQMEKNGILTPPNSLGKREILAETDE
jgi:S-DNA-T family DNA segregation ATPase FtsK/SpoIIIE